MNPTLVTTLSFLLFALTTYFSLPFTHAEIVKDIHGKPIVPSGRYLLWPNYFVTGGGLRLAKTDNSTCPDTILQGYSDVGGDGLPVKFIPQNTSTDDPISTGIELEIAVDENTPECAKSSKWAVLHSGIGGARYFLGIGLERVVENGVFKIERHGSGYKLMFLYSNLSYVVVKYNDENGMRLIYSFRNEEHFDIFEFVFVDVDDPRSTRSVV